MFDDMLVQDLSALIYRLLPSVSHEINNSMQVVRGALALAAEELDSPAELENYIQLCLEETAAVVTIINRLRDIPYMYLEAHEPFDLNIYLKEMLRLLKKYLSKKNIRVLNQVSSDEFLVVDICHLRHLVLFILVDVIDALFEVEGNELYIETKRGAQAALVVLAVESPHQFDFKKIIEASEPAPQKAFKLIPRLVSENNVGVRVFADDGRDYLELSFPLSGVA